MTIEPVTKTTARRAIAPDHIYDIVVIGGGINGAGIARDAAGRGLSVLLCEQNDLASATSSASSKLIHGGLRYLEHYEFQLVSKALLEREVLLKCAPHLIRPLRFVMPHVPELRPAWMIRLGLFLYDHLGPRGSLPASKGVDLRNYPFGSGLKPEFSKGFLYSDCRVDDARLVIVNALSAADMGAVILPHTACVAASRSRNLWTIALHGQDGHTTSIASRALVNAAGPWAQSVLADASRKPSSRRGKLVQGSHIVIPKAYDGEHAYILQNADRRVVFMIPYEGAYTLVGTTDISFYGEPQRCTASEEEIAYLCQAINRYLAQPVSRQDVLWSYSGLRPLFDDGSSDPSAITRDYVLMLDDQQGGVPIVSVFGGKITTYRRLAEQVMEKLAPYFPSMAQSWTAHRPLPGGNLPDGDLDKFSRQLAAQYSQLPVGLLRDLARRHGTLSAAVLGDAQTEDHLGRPFGGGLYQKEIDYLVEREWALTADDVLWRRTKVGLHMNEAQRAAVAAYLAKQIDSVSVKCP